MIQYQKKDAIIIHFFKRQLQEIIFKLPDNENLEDIQRAAVIKKIQLNSFGCCSNTERLTSGMQHI